MTKYKIFTKTKGWSGKAADVIFVAGVGETDNPVLVDWFKRKGYEVVEVGAEQKEAEPKATTTRTTATKK